MMVLPFPSIARSCAAHRAGGRGRHRALSQDVAFLGDRIPYRSRMPNSRCGRSPIIRSCISTLLGAFFLGACPGVLASDAAPIREMTIAEARASESGTAVRVTGIVTVQSGAFASSLSTGFAIQDGTAGIYVLDREHAFELGDRVRVTGRRGAEFDQRHIRLDSAEKLPVSGTVVPRTVRTGRVGESEAGYLIRTAGRVNRAEDDAPYGYKVFIDDGSGELQVFIDASTELFRNATTWKPGDSIEVIGFAGRYKKIYEIMPRIPADMRKQARH